MLTHTKLIAPPRYTSLPKHYKYLTSLIKKFRDDLQKPSKSSHLLRGFSQTNHFFPTHSLQTWPVSRIKPYELQKLHEHKFTSQPIYHIILSLNKLTMSFAGVLNSMMNSFQLRGPDTIQLAKHMTKDIRNNSQFDQLSQHSKQGPTKYRKDLSKRRIGHRPEHQMLFLLVLL